MNTKEITEHVKNLKSEEVAELVNNLKKEGVIADSGCPPGYKMGNDGFCHFDPGK